MKRIIFVLAFISLAFTSSAQIEKGNYMIGNSLANLKLQLEKDGTKSFMVMPKAGWFLKNNLALGGQLNLGYIGAKSSDVFQYGIKAFGRYYVNDKGIEILKKGRFFFEANAGISGSNTKSGGVTNTNNGFGFGFGPGYSYFITKNVGLEAGLMYNGQVGFGNEPYMNDLQLNVGFQLYFKNKK